MGIVTLRVQDRFGGISAPVTRTINWASGGSDPFFTPPAGYSSLFYGVDFTQLSALPAGWVVRTGKTNAAHTFRAQNVAVVPGKGLVHTAEKVNGVIYSGAVNGNINIPSQCVTRFIARCPEFDIGLWPSMWKRPQSGGSDGEIDDLEGFGGHLVPSVRTGSPRISGATLIATLNGSYTGATYARSNFNLPDDSMRSNHTYETRMTPTGFLTFVDGVAKQTITRGGTGGAAMPTAKYDAQFNPTTAKTWYARTDFQIGDTTDGGGSTGTEAGPWAGTRAEWIIEKYAIFVPA
jgi:hypothetical protein